MRMKPFLFVMLFLLGMASTRAATITGTLVDVAGDPVQTAIVFDTYTVKSDPPNTVLPGRYRMTNDADGTFSVTLQRGNYTVSIPSSTVANFGAKFNVYVPGGSGTYALSDLTPTAASITGEANTVESVGGGESLYSSKAAEVLRLKSIVAGTNVTVVSTDTNLTISAEAGGIGADDLNAEQLELDDGTLQIKDGAKSTNQVLVGATTLSSMTNSISTNGIVMYGDGISFYAGNRFDTDGQYNFFTGNGSSMLRIFEPFSNALTLESTVSGAFGIRGMGSLKIQPNGEETVFGLLTQLSDYSVTFSDTVAFRDNDGIKLPSGTTAQRPASAISGVFRFNSTTTDVEFWDGSEWVEVSTGEVIDARLSSNIPRKDDANVDFEGNASFGGSVTADSQAVDTVTATTVNATSLVAPNGILVEPMTPPSAIAGSGRLYSDENDGLPYWIEPTGTGGQVHALAGGSGLPASTAIGEVLVGNATDYVAFPLGLRQGAGETEAATSTPLLTNALPANSLTTIFFKAQSAEYADDWSLFDGHISVWNLGGTITTNAAVITEEDASGDYHLSFGVDGTSLIINGHNASTNHAQWSLLQTHVISTPRGDEYVSSSVLPGIVNLQWAYEMDETSGFDLESQADPLNDFNHTGVMNLNRTALVANSTNAVHGGNDGDYAFVNNGKPSHTASTDFGLSMWIQPDAIPASTTDFTGQWRTDIPQRQWRIRCTSAGLVVAEISQSGGSVSQTLTSTTALSTSVPRHIVLTWESGGNVELYIDGALEDSEAFGGIYSGAVIDLQLNKTQNAAGTFGATYDQYHLWLGTTDAYLSAANVTALYGGGDGVNWTMLQP